MMPHVGSAQHELQILLEVAIAMALGGVVGLERETAGKSAGVRTHMLIAGASAFLVALGFSLVVRAMAIAPADVVAADPIRIVQAIIIGIGFVGAGTIVRDARTGSVHGLTTAASLLTASAVGISVALAHYVLAVGVTILVAVTLRVAGVIERRFAGS